MSDVPLVPPLFDHNARTTLNRVIDTFTQRGTEYGDTWRDCQWLAFKAAAKEMGLDIPDDCLRPIAAAVLVDIKYQRLQGGYKEDSLIDGIAYSGNFTEEMRAWKANRVNDVMKQLQYQ